MNNCKRNKHYLVNLLVLYSVLVLVTFSKCFAQETIRIATGEFPPYYSQKYENYGQTLHIVSKAFSIMNITVAYTFFPWGRSYELAKKNDWDATCCWSNTPERERHFNYSDAIRTTDVVFFHLKDTSFDWHTYDDLKNIAIGTTARYTYGIEFDKANKAGTLRVENATSDELNFRKLLGRRIKIIPVNRVAGYQILADLFTPEEAQLITHHPKSLVLYKVKLMVSKKNKNSQYLLERFNEGLKRLKESGKHD